MTLDDITLLENCNLKEMLKNQLLHTANCSLSCRLQSDTAAARTHSSHLRATGLLHLSLPGFVSVLLSPSVSVSSAALSLSVAVSAVAVTLSVTVMLSVSTISSDQLGLSLFWIVSLTISALSLELFIPVCLSLLAVTFKVSPS